MILNFFLCIILLIKYIHCYTISSYTNNIRVFITGSNGVLGNKLVKNYLSDHGESSCDVIASSRKTLDLLKLDNLIEFPVDDNFFHFNNENEQHIILINNAAVCLSGNSNDIKEETLLVNTIAPIKLSTLLYNDHRLYKNNKITIINISSGEGELIYLNTKIQSDIKDLQNINDLNNYINQLYNKNIDNYNDSDNKIIEYAFGDTPWYSISKALLNKFTILKNDEEVNLLNHNKKNNMNIYSICPGDFISSMTSKYDKNNAENNDINEIVQNIIKISLNKENLYQSGEFYNEKLQKILY